ncbi:hypothetical protein ABFS82_07G019300 [Erythranthe guttata]
MRDLGKQMLSKQQEIEEEEEIRKLLLGIMEDYYDSVIPPLSFFSPSSGISVADKKSGTKRQRNEDSCDENSLKERKRREKLSGNFSVLTSMVPNLSNNYKPTRETVINEAVNYIKHLEEEAKRLEGLKQFQLEEPMMESPVLLKCTNQNSSVKVAVSSESTFLSVQLPSRRGSALKIVKVIEKHRARVLEARICVNEQRQLTFTATITLGKGGGSSTIDKIREEILSL